MQKKSLVVLTAVAFVALVAFAQDIKTAISKNVTCPHHTECVNAVSGTDNDKTTKNVCPNAVNCPNAANCAKTGKCPNVENCPNAGKCATNCAKGAGCTEACKNCPNAATCDKNGTCPRAEGCVNTATCPNSKNGAGACPMQGKHHKGTAGGQCHRMNK